MRNAFFSFIFVLSASIVSGAQGPAPGTEDFRRIDADPAAGFAYPYYLYVPPEIRASKDPKKIHTIFVAPNNTGKPDDDFGVHEADVRKRIRGSGPIASALKVAVVIPVFPRPATDWKIYTQALDRDSLVTDKKEYRRLDLQLVAMIDDARARLAKEKLKFDKRVLINGFSAQGMFANRFAFLHPHRVKAAAIGSPGGWPIAPVAIYKEKPLRYPIGTSDFKEVSGHRLKLNSLRKVPLFIFLGDQDDNDSVPFGDSYDDADRELILPLLGKTPIDRWEISKELYRSAGLNAEFRLYPGVKHTVNEQMRNDIRAFFAKYVQ